MAAASAEEEEEEEEEEDDELDEEPEVFFRPVGKERTSVSAEAYGAWNKREYFTPVVVPKTDEQMARIQACLATSFLFSELDERELDVVTSAMREVQLEAGMRIIHQGEDGDSLFVIEDGVLECKVLAAGAESVVKTVGPGDVFGELALLYNCPRAATVESSTPCILWQLDRDTFSHIVKEAAMTKRQRNEAFLQSVPLLASMCDDERAQVSDALRTQKAPSNSAIITQGEPGNTFYILEEGTCVAFRAVNGEPPTQVMEYGPGSYFGELALLNNEPRAASVVAVTDVKLLTLSRASFSKMLGPFEVLLGRGEPLV